MNAVPTPNTFALVVPTLNPGAQWLDWIKGLKRQTSYPCLVLVLDSESTDETVLHATNAGLSVVFVERRSFNHGGTRNLALQHLPACVDVAVFMTQDALLADVGGLGDLIAAFGDSSVACAFGRQLPHQNASVLAAHARLFNYPCMSRVVSLEDRHRLGLKTCFVSNSFAAYRVRDLMSVGGFPTDVILGEDMYVAAKLLMAGKRIAYVADACVHHSHNYSVVEEFRRYFDTGVFHVRNPWLLETFGRAGGEGLRFVQSEMKYLLKNTPMSIPSALLRTFAKWLGYRFGRLEALFPLWFKRRCSMHRGYWR